MISSRVVCLHGFWGSPSDFDFLKEKFPALEAVDVTSHSEKTLGEWSAYFKKQFIHQTPVTFVGYSQGGRLILEGLRDLPIEQRELIHKIVLLSTGVSFPNRSLDEMKARALNDQAWAQRFLSESLESLFADWNNQEVLKTSKRSPQPKELTRVQRMALAQCLNHWSQASQSETLSVIEKFVTKILFTVGQHDPKYVALAHNLKKQLPNLKTQVVEQAGHRLLIDAPDAVISLIQS